MSPTDETGQPPIPRGDETYYRGGERDVSVFYDDLAPFGSVDGFPALRLRLGSPPYALRLAALYQRPLGLERLRLDLGLGLRMGLDTFPLRPLGIRSLARVVLGSRHGLGPRLGGLEDGRSLPRLGALPPDAEFIPGMGIRSSGFDIPSYFWIFVDGRHFWDDRLDRYVLPYERNLTIINYTVVNINIRSRGDRVYNEGFDPDEAYRLTRRPVTRYRLQDPGRPGQARLEGNEVLIHKPALSPNRLARPKTVLRADQAGDALAGDAVDDRSVGEEQIRERRLLEESQKEEIGVIRRKIEEDRKLAKSSADKIKIDREVETKVSELRKKHETEKADLEKRQKQDEDKIKKGKLKKKD